MTTLDKMLQGLANALGASLSTLTTTAKTVVGAINELKSGLTTANTNISTNTTKIGTGSLNTTSQTLIGAVNELAARGIPMYSGTKTFAAWTSNSALQAIYTVTPTKKSLFIGSQLHRANGTYFNSISGISIKNSAGIKPFMGGIGSVSISGDTYKGAYFLVAILEPNTTYTFYSVGDYEQNPPAWSYAYMLI